MRTTFITLVIWAGLHSTALAVPGLPVSSPFSSHPDDSRCVTCHFQEPVITQSHCPQCHEPAVSSGKPAAHPITAGPVPSRSPGNLPARWKDMLLVPSGPFIMGFDHRHPDEGPAHSVTLDHFYIDQYEVTNTQYEKFVRSTAQKTPQHWREGTPPPEVTDHPVVHVSWHDARDYCHWAGKRLPTESEWEKAARGTDGRIFPWGNRFDVHKANTPQYWASRGTRGHTLRTGSFPEGRSPYGSYDMGGNVWEWTASWYLPHPGNTHLTENYGHQYRVAKGGSWKNCSFYRCGVSAPTFNRGFFNPKTRNSGFGFRCAGDGPKTSPVE